MKRRENLPENPFPAKTWLLGMLLFLQASGLGITGKALAQKSHPSGWQWKDTAVFRFPMKLSPEISGSFGELRSTHFHGGMDFRTLQREGIKVYSIAPGRITKAEVSESSYGNALYVTHPNGMVSLYAHLSRFTPAVQRKIKRRQRQEKSFEVALDSLRIKVRRKRPIGRSGNSGASGGPHLHLEIRQGGDRLNPACFGLAVNDHLSPELYYVAFYLPGFPKESGSAQGGAMQESGPGQGNGQPIASSPLPCRTDSTADDSLPDGADAGLSASIDSCMQASFMDAPRWDARMYRAISSQISRCRQAGSRNVSAQRQWLRLGNPLPEWMLDASFPGSAKGKACYYRAESLPDTVWVEGPCAFGLCALDKIQGMPFHYGLYELAFLAERIPEAGDSGTAGHPAGNLAGHSPLSAPGRADTLAYYRLDRIPDSLYGEIGLHVDTAFFALTGKRAEKGWNKPGEPTPYRKTRGNGFLAVPPGSLFRIRIVARDFAGNESRKTFLVGRKLQEKSSKGRKTATCDPVP